MITHGHRPVCDYEGSAYRTEFWGQGRDYEHAAERVALKQLLPRTGHRLIDVGGGYGRLVPLYNGYDEVVIFDYAISQLPRSNLTADPPCSTSPGTSTSSPSRQARSTPSSSSVLSTTLPTRPPSSGASPSF